MLTSAGQLERGFQFNMNPLRLPLLCLGAFLCHAASVDAQPIQLHPENPHYFQFRGQAIVLVTSAEHYGSVLNPDFDYVRYLDTLQKDGLNLTRLFIGTYLERPGDFGIKWNTLAPAAGRALTPWARSSEPGAVWGGAKFDLDKWDENFFTRLKDFVTQADRRGVVVEVTLFSDYYGTRQSPLFKENNVNGVGDVPSEQMNTQTSNTVLAHQQRVVNRVVREINPFDNVIFEIQNEPWVADGVLTRVLLPSLTTADFKDPIQFWKNRVSVASDASLAWQRLVASWITEAERSLPKRHLISQNYANFVQPLAAIDPTISVLNFHYGWPDLVRLNYGFDRVLSVNETGFAGREDATYRKQAWRFMLAGGGAFNSLDYSFTVGHEDGTTINEAPGGGSVALRRQLGVLRRFLEASPLPRMRPDNSTVLHAPGTVPFVLSTADRRNVLLYLDGKGPTMLSLELPPGTYAAEWLEPATGTILKPETVNHSGGRVTLASPPFAEEIALALRR